MRSQSRAKDTGHKLEAGRSRAVFIPSGTERIKKGLWKCTSFSPEGPGVPGALACGPPKTMRRHTRSRPRRSRGSADVFGKRAGSRSGEGHGTKPATPLRPLFLENSKFVPHGVAKVARSCHRAGVAAQKWRIVADCHRAGVAAGMWQAPVLLQVALQPDSRCELRQSWDAVRAETLAFPPAFYGKAVHG